MASRRVHGCDLAAVCAARFQQWAWAQASKCRIFQPGTYVQAGLMRFALLLERMQVRILGKMWRSVVHPGQRMMQDALLSRQGKQAWATRS